jgi:hypothetical protein
MAGRLILDGVEVLHLDEARLPKAVLPRHSGAVSLSRAHPGDRYELDAEPTACPFTAWRDSAWAWRKPASDSVTLVRTGCREWLRDCIPLTLNCGSPTRWRRALRRPRKS